MGMLNWLLGSSKDVNTSNPQSMHYKGARVGDEVIPVGASPCYCGMINLNRGFNDGFVVCEFCKEAERELKPKYKWSWKLNKAVRL